MKFEDIKKLHEKKFREKLEALRHRRRAPRAGAGEGRDARCAPAREQDLRDARLCALVEHAADARHPVQAHGADQRDAFAAGHCRGGAAARARRAARRESARSIFTRSRIPAISAPSCARWRGSEISAASAAPTAWTCTTARWCARAWAPSSMCRSSSMCRWTRCRKRFPRIACLDLDGQPDRVAGVPGIRLLRVRQRSARPAARADERRSVRSRSRLPGPARSNR